ncbi:MAG: hypothetical protein ACJARD_000369 [Alphaproteobacteria bacterium]|jgi:hypothetical protein
MAHEAEQHQHRKQGVTSLKNGLKVPIIVPAMINDILGDGLNTNDNAL